MSAEAVRVVELIQDILSNEDLVAVLEDEGASQGARQMLMELADPDFAVVMVGPEYLGPAPERTGADGFREAWADWTSPFESYRIDVEQVIDAGDQVVSLVAMHGKTKTGGVQIDASAAAVWTVVDGRLRRVEFHLDRRLALRAAGLD